ncbi:MAG TPA: ABC transporter substrate-binding protein [Candidatus Binatia bacterium]|nr:ABC transporter substrate-binding protein [Candidatus Binatia bacterium]
MAKRFLSLVLLLASAHLAEAQQQPKKIPRIALVAFGTSEADNPRQKVFLQSLRDLGWIEQQDISIERRYANESYGQLVDIANELVRLRVDVIVVRDSVAIRPVMQSTKTIPIVMAVSGDPVAAGLINSLARPGGNITGLTNISPQLAGKRLELLKEAVPKVSNVAALGSPDQQDWKEFALAAQQIRIRLKALRVESAHQFDELFNIARRDRANGLIVLPSSLTNLHREQIVSLAVKNRLPAMYGVKGYVTVGGLMSYGPNLADLHGRAAYYVDKILKGAKPGDLPVEQPKKFEFVINLNAAKQIGLTIPPNVLARADKVIR